MNPILAETNWADAVVMMFIIACLTTAFIVTNYFDHKDK